MSNTYRLAFAQAVVRNARRFGLRDFHYTFVLSVTSRGGR